MKSKIQHCFPDSVMLHNVTLSNGTRLPIYVDPSETFGHALARAGFGANQVDAIEVGGPISYEPDFAVATR